MVTRRRARRRALAAAVVLTALVVVIDVAVRSFSDGPDQRLAYLDEARPHIEDSSAQAGDLSSLLREARSLDRVTFDRRLERLQREAQATSEEVEALDPPPSLTRADAYLISTLAVRFRVTTDLEPAFEIALGQGTVPEAVDRLGALASDLLLADRTYLLFVEEAARAEDTVTLPESTWIANLVAWQQPALEELVTGVRSAGTLAAVHDIAVVTVQVSPPPVVQEGDVGVLATADPLRVTVIVGNRGSEAERMNVVAGFDGMPQSVVAEAVELEPGQDLTVVLEPVPPPEAGVVTLVVRVDPVTGEQATADNEHRIALRVRSPDETAPTTVPSITTTAAPPEEETATG
jgi:hypothetical protein